MFKKIAVTLLSILVIGAGLGFLFRESLWEIVQGVITKDMYVAADVDDFSSGLAVGDRFPEIRAMHSGAAINSVGQFVHDKGMIFVANRSANW